MNFKIVTDSSSNIFSMEDASFSSVPLKIITDQKEFVDDPQLNLEEMLSYLASYKGRSGTSCPNIQEWLDAFGDADGVGGAGRDVHDVALELVGQAHHAHAPYQA